MTEQPPPLKPELEFTPDSVAWRRSVYAAQHFESERPYLEQALKQIAGPRVLQVGERVEQSLITDLDFPQLIIASIKDDVTIDAQFRADPAFLPIAPDSISSVILPHVIEGQALPHQILREVHRVLMSDGYLVLSGFNPYSLIGLQRWLRPGAVRPGPYYSPRRVIDWLQLLGFEVVGSAMFQYAPLSKSPRIQKIVGFLNAIGDRWLPMFGGGYMITAKKREHGMTLVGKLEFTKSNRKLRAAASIKTAHGCRKT